MFPRLGERQRQLAGTFSGGEAQMLAIGRALMTQPRLLLCDEPSLGLAPGLVREVLATLAAAAARAGVTVVLADQNALAALRIADRGYVLDTGPGGRERHRRRASDRRAPALGLSRHRRRGAGRERAGFDRGARPAFNAPSGRSQDGTIQGRDAQGDELRRGRRRLCDSRTRR